MAGTLFAQSGKKTNLELLEEDISGRLEKLIYYPDVKRELQFVCFVKSVSGDKSEKKFVESVLRKMGEKIKLSTSFAKDESMESRDSIYNKLMIDIIKLKTAYPAFVKNPFLGQKTISREISSELMVSLAIGSGSFVVNESVKTLSKDEILLDDYEQYQSKEYFFTQSIPPDVSWLETVIFPTAVVLVSAVVTILFFTIRSK